jgi:dUTP pyrophosphatase
MNIRGFQEVAEQHKKVKSSTKMPQRSDKKSAGYDFYSKDEITLAPFQFYTFWTDVKAYMRENEVLEVYIRSGLGCKGLRLRNCTGIIDSSYFENPDNDGNIGLCIVNESGKDFRINIGDRLAQGIFKTYLVADNDSTIHTERQGGFGSSGQ